MKCDVCNAEVPNESAFCNRCGKPIDARLGNPQNPHVIAEVSLAEISKMLRLNIILRPNEKISWIWMSFDIKLRNARATDGNVQAYMSGFLLATNQRAFLIGWNGSFNKIIDTLAFEDISSITTRKGFWANPLIIGSNNGEVQIGRFFTAGVCGKKALEAIKLELVQEHLSRIVQERLREIELEKQKGRVQYVLDFSFLKAEMEKGGLIVQTIKCPSCGGSLPLPQSGNSIHCPYCGSTAYAQDVFEKMKGLLNGL